MTDRIEDKIAEIIMDCNDQHGLRAYEAADRILALPEICFVMDQKDDPRTFVTIDEVRITHGLKDEQVDRCAECGAPLPPEDDDYGGVLCPNCRPK